MLRLKLGRSLSNDVIEPEKPTATERFTRVLDRLKFEYDLPNDVLAEAEAVLQALKARERNAHLPALSKLEGCMKHNRPGQSSWRSGLLQRTPS